MEKETLFKKILSIVGTQRHDIEFININKISNTNYILLMKVRNLESNLVEWIVCYYNQFYKLHNTHYFKNEIKAHSRYSYILMKDN